jgi:phosphatidylserine/phosphatidylglycerophosphate/cardiolipin synthase-like enzyme
MIEAYFSPGPNCLKHILDLIRKATSSIDVCVFTISDDRIRDVLIDAWNRGLEIRILTDNFKVFDEGSDIEFLYDNGIPVKVDNTENHMHHKFLIIDNHTVLTGSYNWTRSAERYNQENVISLKNETITAQFQSEFNHLWDSCSDFTLDH